MAVLENTKRLIKRGAQLKLYQVSIIAAGVINLIIGLPMIIPSTDPVTTAMLNKFNKSLGLGGDKLAPPDEAIHWFFLNLSGLLIAFLGILLIWCSLRIIQRLKIPAMIAAPKFLAGLLIVYYVVRSDMLQIMIGFAVIDMAFSVLFLYCYFSLKNKV